jgi:hypothetical protein
MADTASRLVLRIVFEADGFEAANAVVLREADDTDQRHIWRTRLFRMACAIGLLEETNRLQFATD